MRVEGEYIVVDTEHVGYPVAGRTPEEITEHATRMKEYWASKKARQPPR